MRPSASTILHARGDHGSECERAGWWGLISVRRTTCFTGWAPRSQLYIIDAAHRHRYARRAAAGGALRRDRVRVRLQPHRRSDSCGQRRRPELAPAAGYRRRRGCRRNARLCAQETQTPAACRASPPRPIPIPTTIRRRAPPSSCWMRDSTSRPFRIRRMPASSTRSSRSALTLGDSSQLRHQHDAGADCGVVLREFAEHAVRCHQWGAAESGPRRKWRRDPCAGHLARTITLFFGGHGRQSSPVRTVILSFNAVRRTNERAQPRARTQTCRGHAVELRNVSFA